MAPYLFGALFLLQGLTYLCLFPFPIVAGTLAGLIPLVYAPWFVAGCYRQGVLWAIGKTWVAWVLLQATAYLAILGVVRLMSLQ